MKHYAFMTTAWDLGIYEQVIWSTANTGRVFWYTVEIVINPSCNFFGIHFSPFLFLIVPVYALFQATETLLILQAFFLAFGAIPLYKLAYHERHSYKQALALAIIYLAYPPIHGVALFDFHIQAFLPFLFFYAFYYFKKEEWDKYFPFIILSLMTIEFVSLIVIFFGFYGLWINRKKIFESIRIFNPKDFLFTKSIFFSITTIILGFVWFVAARNIMLNVNPSAPPHPNWAAFGDPVHNLPGFIIDLLTNPVRAIEVIFTSADQKALYILGLLAPLAFLPFLDFPSLVIGAPWFFVAFLSNYPPYYALVGYQYVAFVVPFVFISAVCGIEHLSLLKQRVCIFKRFGGIFKREIVAQNLRTLTILFLSFSIASSCIITILSYSGSLARTADVPIITEHDRVVKAFTELIPSQASVLTQNDLFPHVSKRLYAYVAGEFSRNLPPTVTYDYILMDTRSTWYEEPLKNLVYNLTRVGVFGVQYAADGVWILKRNYHGEAIYPIETGVFVNFHNQGILVKVFNKTSFNNKPTYERLQSSISFGLEFNDPQLWVKGDSFALRFEGWLYAPVAGNYSFQLESLGPSSLHLDGQKVLCCDDSALYCIRRLNCVSWLERGFHQIKVEYLRTDFFPPFVRLLWTPPWESNVAEIQPVFIYSKISPEVSSPFLDLNWNFGSRSPFPLVNSDHFSAFANCSMHASSSGIYKFKVTADGYVFISIDGKPVTRILNSTQIEFEFLLTGGHHLFEVDYMTLQGDAKLSVLWMPPGSSEFEEIPSSSLFWQGS